MTGSWCGWARVLSPRACRPGCSPGLESRAPTVRGNRRQWDDIVGVHETRLRKRRIQRRRRRRRLADPLRDDRSGRRRPTPRAPTNRRDPAGRRRRPRSRSRPPRARRVPTADGQRRDATGSDTAEKLADKQPSRPRSSTSPPRSRRRSTISMAGPQDPRITKPRRRPSSPETAVEPAEEIDDRGPKPDAGPQSAAVTFAAAATSAAEITSTAAATPLSGLLSAIGTIVFNLYGFATRLIGGPPTLPPNSTVTVRSSTLLGLTAPTGSRCPRTGTSRTPREPPTRLIYLQHGFLARVRGTATRRQPSQSRRTASSSRPR